MLRHAALTTWFAEQAPSAVQRYTALLSGAPEWRLAQVALDADDRIVAARWLEASAVDGLVAGLHAQDSFVWWHE